LDLREEVTGEWRRYHNEELYNFYFSLCIIEMIRSRGMRWARYVACMAEVRNAYRILRPRHTQEDNFKVDFKDTACGLYSYGS
jgi:hypothetical protein